MHFSKLHKDGNKATKFALVAGLHVAVGVLFVHSINTRKISLPHLTEQVLVMIEPDRPTPPPPPPEPPKPTPKVAPPDLVVPKVEVDVAPPPEPAQVQAAVDADPSPQPFTPPAQGAPDGPPASAANANTGPMRTAVLADANACALPDYPVRAARNGETGTTTLALLVGTDGRVSSARVEHTSGSHELDRAAVNALSLCRFKPATANGAPEAGWAQIAYVWKLD